MYHYVAAAAVREMQILGINNNVSFFNDLLLA